MSRADWIIEWLAVAGLALLLLMVAIKAHIATTDRLEKIEACVCQTDATEVTK